VVAVVLACSTAHIVLRFLLLNWLFY